jgi:hypothetical protein
MKEKVYIETSIISYLVSKTNRDIIITAKQELTKEWWFEHKSNYDLFISDLVIEEISKGDSVYADERLKIVENIPILKVTEKALLIANSIVSKKILPSKATDDILHISLAIANNIEYLLTWNCKHIANAHIIKTIEAIAKFHKCNFPVLCTPIEILGGYNEL